MKKLWLGDLILKALRWLPSKYPIGKKDFEASPIFVINAGRSGSTLFNRLLNDHPAIVAPTEQYFIHNLIIKFQLYNFILWRDLAKIMTGELINGLETHTWEWNYEPIIKEIIHAKGEERYLLHILDKIVFEYAKQNGKMASVWADTTPLTARYIKQVYGVYPNARYIYLARDGRDVVASYKAGGGVKPFMQYANHLNGALNWASVYKQAQWISNRARYFKLVKYEDLVQQPEQTMLDVFSFIQLEPAAIQTSGIELPPTEFFKSPFHQNLKNPINSNSIGKWQSALTEQELREIDPIIQKPMQALGYL